MGSPGRGVAGAKNDLNNSLDKLDDLNYVVDAMIASPSYPDLIATYWKGSLRNTLYTAFRMEKW
jgi:hypothetical protein